MSEPVIGTVIIQRIMKNMNKPLVFIILVNYNGEADTIECIQSLNGILYDNYRIVLVDNGSSKPISAAGKSFFEKNCHVIYHDRNSGFAGGNNIGIQYAIKEGADLVLLLNNDTTVEPDFLNVLVEQYEKNKAAGAMGSRINYFDNKNMIWYGGGYFEPKDGWGRHEKNREICVGRTGIVKEVTFITGCLMLIPKNTIEKIGLLDDSLFLYFEDVDYCCRITKAGMKMLYCEDAVIYHKVYGSTSGNSDIRYYFFLRNIPVIIKRHCINKLNPFIRHFIFCFKMVVKKQIGIHIAMKAILDFLTNKLGPYSDNK